MEYSHGGRECYRTSDSAKRLYALGRVSRNTAGVGSPCLRNGHLTSCPPHVRRRQVELNEDNTETAYADVRHPRHNTEKVAHRRHMDVLFRYDDCADKPRVDYYSWKPEENIAILICVHTSPFG